MMPTTHFSCGGSSVLAAILCIGVCDAAAQQVVAVDSALLKLIDAVEVPAPEDGVLRDLRVREGQRVKLGDVLVVVDPREAELAAAAAREELKVATHEASSDIRVRLADKESRVAHAELARAISVNNDLPNTVSAKEVDRLQLAAEKSDLAIENARFEDELLGLRLERLRADVRLADHRVERRRVRAPIAGVVVEVSKRAGEWVDRGDTVARVVNVNRLRVEGYVGVEAALSGIEDRPVEVRVVLPGGAERTATGRVVFVSPEVEPVTAQVRFTAEIDNSDLALRPGLPVSVSIRVSPNEGTADAFTSRVRIP